MTPHHRRSARSDLARLKRIESVYWTLFAVLLVLLSVTVIVQYLTFDPGEDVVAGDWYRRLLSVGLPGLIVLFSLYVTAKRREIQRLKRDLFDQQTLAERLEERTVELEGALEETDRVKRLSRALFSILDRDVRAPLDRIRRAPADSGGGARREIDGLFRLVNDLIELADLESGRISWSLSAQTVPGILRDVFHETDPVAHARGVALIRNHEERLPEILVDRNRLTRALSRMTEWTIRNAPGGGTVEFTARAEKGEVRIGVRSEGAVFSDEERESFSAFLDEEKGKAPESVTVVEIGLALAHRVANHFGGRLVLEEGKEGKRSCAIILPAPTLSASSRREVETAAAV